MRPNGVLCRIARRNRPRGLRHGHEDRDRGRSRRLPDHRHVVRIAAKGGDIVAHETQRRDLIEQSEIAVAHPRQAQKPQRTKPVVDRNHDHVAVGGKPLAGIPRQRTRSARESTAVDPHQHRALLRNRAQASRY